MQRGWQVRQSIRWATIPGETVDNSSAVCFSQQGAVPHATMPLQWRR